MSTVGGFMKRIFKKLILLLPVLIFLNHGVVRAQDVATIPIRVSDDAIDFPGDSLWLYLANTPNGTWGRDSLNFIYEDTFAWYDLPSFQAKWVSFASYANSTYTGGIGSFAQGLQPMDIRGIPSNPAQEDTFVVFCTNADGFAASANFTLRWPGMKYLSARCDSMFLLDKTGQLTSDGVHPFGKINMFTQDSLFIFQPLQVFANFKLIIYKYGATLVDSLTGLLLTVTSAPERSDRIPSSFKLLQNYPNPFNPATQISYTLARASTVTLTVYDILGREVTTLVNEKQEPGNHSVSWNASTVPSGVYFYTLRSGTEHDVKRLVILR